LFSLGFTTAGEPILSAEATHERRLWSVDREIRGVTSRFQSDSPVTAITMLKGREMLAAGCEDGSIVLYDLGQRQIKRRFEGEHARVNRLAFSDNGDFCAAIGDDHKLRIWGTENKPLFEREVTHEDGKPEGLLFDLAVSPGGRHVAVGGDLNLTIFDARSGTVVARRYGHNNQVLAVAYSPDGRLLATGSRDNLIGLWDVASYKRVALLSGHKSAVNHVAFSADGARLVSVGQDRTVRVWNIAERSLTRTLRGHSSEVTRAIIPRVGDTILSTDYYGTVMLWDTRLGHSLGQFNQRRQQLLDIAMSETESIWIAALAEWEGPRRERERQVLLWHLPNERDETRF
jgi:WD40 repeat protein